MIKIDLITGFLGAGKTTFIKKYAKYLIDSGLNICILENDFGPINIDMMLLDCLDCDKEMVSGGCDYDCHFRRFKTKLIQMALKRYDRVIVEPSGLFHTDEFFDALYEEPLDSLYEIGNIFCIYDFNTKNLSDEAKSFLASELCVASKIIVSKDEENKKLDTTYINEILNEFNSDRIITDNDVIYNNNLDFDSIINSGYHSSSTRKIINSSNKFDSIYFMELNISLEKIKEIADILFKDLSYGIVKRIKGFVKDNDKWIRINLTKDNNEIVENSIGQEVFIVIGEDLNKEKINDLFMS